MKIIPFGGLKQEGEIFLQTHLLRDNEDNPLRGIETKARQKQVMRGTKNIVTMKIIPFGGLKQEMGRIP